MTNRSLFNTSGASVRTCFSPLIITVTFLVLAAPAFAVEELIVIGHKSPDTDTVISAITYANLKNMMGVKEAFPAVSGDLDNETKFVLGYFKVPYPEKITDCQHRCGKVILVDHNDMAQTVDNLNMENVVEVVDHHRVGGFTNGKAIFFLIEPAGATGGIIANLYEQNSIPISREMAGLMVSAILSDTVLLKSPTSSPRDAAAVEKLAKIAGVDPVKFGAELIRVKTDIAFKSAMGILMGDFKEFNFSGTKSGVGQVEVADLNVLTLKRAAILEEMKKVKDSMNLDMVVMMLTNVMKESSDLLFVGNATAAKSFEKAFGGKIVNNSIYREKLLSRKLQVIPLLEAAFKK